MLLDENNKKYKIFVEKLYKKCQQTQTENERNVLRITNVKKLIRRRTKDVEILKKRLDRYNDNWRHVPMQPAHPKRKIEQKRGPKPKPKNPNEPPKEKKTRKRRMKKNHEKPIEEILTVDGLHQQQLAMQTMRQTTINKNEN